MRQLTNMEIEQVAGGVQPANPGGFGQDRAAFNHEFGGQTEGQILSSRAGDNGAINNDYKVTHGDLPAGVTPGP
jgi:hypothetical protein